MDDTLPDSTALLIAAGETDDEIGLVLRMHLQAEELLRWFVQRRVEEGGLRNIIQEPRTFGSALAFAAALGLPPALARVAQQINVIRNKLAHGAVSLDSAQVETLASLVDRIAEWDQEWKPLSERYVELPAKFPGEVLTYGKHGNRIDFLMASLSFYQATALWLEGYRRGLVAPHSIGPTV